MDDNHLPRQAPALDPARRPSKTAYMTGQNGEPLHPEDPNFVPGAKVTRVHMGYDRDGDAIYEDHYFIGGSK